MSENYIEKSRNYYDKWVAEKDEERAVGWMQKHSQRLAFIELFSVIQPPLSSDKPLKILDVGCGLGAFYEFLREKNINFRYTGWDIHPESIKRSKLKYPDVEFDIRDLLTATESNYFDYVFASGAFSVNLVPEGGKEEIQLKYVQNALSKMYALCREGMAANLLSFYGQGPVKDKDLFYYRPEYILSIARSLNSKIVLNHDYRPDAFSVFIFKNTSRVVSEIGNHTPEAEMNWFLRGGMNQVIIDQYSGKKLTTALEHAYYSSALLNLHRTDEARKVLKKGLALDDKCEVIYLNLGSCDFAEKKYKSALSFFEKARSIEPKNPYTNRIIQFTKKKLKS